MDLKRRIPQYAIGLFVMALGIVLIKKAELGMSPISSIPSAISNITPFTLGNMIIAFQLVCFVLIIIVMKRVTVKTVLTIPLAVGFGYIIDLYMFLLPIGNLPFVLRCVVCFAGIFFTALGIDIIKGASLMLPAPDELLLRASEEWKKPFPIIKICGDILWVVIAFLIELILVHRISSVGIGTVASMILTGRIAGMLSRHMHFLEMEPLELKRKKE